MKVYYNNNKKTIDISFWSITKIYVLVSLFILAIVWGAMMILGFLVAILFSLPA